MSSIFKLVTFLFKAETNIIFVLFISYIIPLETAYDLLFESICISVKLAVRLKAEGSILFTLAGKYKLFKDSQPLKAE